MARTVRKQLSQEDFVTHAAQLVAGTINNEEMDLTVEEVDIENFIKYFKEKALEMLEAQDFLLLSIGPAINTDGEGIFSNNMQTILDFIEEKMHTKFYFHYGILLWLGKNSLAANWLPH